ncbi:hypothetical protein bpr_IV044 (plasmid) [Butyrivibrio proteoclasticus B316]|uniref:Uncharacterized protein n=1 Tax=Butyrivibrio proteoclasticus (strain ATCC 51982 / DSM 14932 / B316) TaxID=515622 RepID=E0S4S7_BUTPB|nr:hypothetical protein [Butyrivibrio proteoclasticus]ADL36409.1 hypothetical protein bpr_IV044 [Butyrivibrio proteoclasticus B316]
MERNLTMVVSGIEVYPVDVTSLEDKSPVYIEFDGNSAFTSQWGIVDQKLHRTIHKDFIITFNDRCRYYGLYKDRSEKKEKKGVIVKF